MMSLADDDRDLLRAVLTVAQETRDAALRAAQASEEAIVQLRTLNEIVAREVSPLGQFRADVVKTIGEHFDKTAALKLEVSDLRERVAELEQQADYASNGGE